MAIEICVNIGFGNGLLSDGTESLPELMLANQQLNSVALEPGFTESTRITIVYNEFENFTFKIAAKSPSPRGQ